MHAKMKCNNCAAEFIVESEYMMKHPDEPLACPDCGSKMDAGTIARVRRAFASVEEHVAMTGKTNTPGGVEE